MYAGKPHTLTDYVRIIRLLKGHCTRLWLYLQGRN